MPQLNDSVVSVVHLMAQKFSSTRIHVVYLRLARYRDRPSIFEVKSEPLDCVQLPGNAPTNLRAVVKRSNDIGRGAIVLQAS